MQGPWLMTELDSNLTILRQSGHKLEMLKIYEFLMINIYYYIPLYYNKINKHKNTRTKQKKDVFCISDHWSET